MILLKMKISFYDFFFSFLDCFFFSQNKIYFMYMCMHTPDCVCVQHNSAGPLKATKKPSHLLELELQSVVSWWPYGCQEPNSGRTKCSCFLSCPFNGSGLVFIPLLWICWFLKSRVSFFVFVFEFYQLECAFKKILLIFLNVEYIL